MKSGFLMLARGPVTDAMLRDKNALHLLTVIAVRARYSSGDGDLAVGQAWVGDFANYDMTEKEYRGAKARLEQAGLVSFTGIRHKGTIATICDSRVFDLNSRRPEAYKGETKGVELSEVQSSFGAIAGAEEIEKGRNKGDSQGVNNGDTEGVKFSEIKGASRGVNKGGDGGDSEGTKRAINEEGNKGNTLADGVSPPRVSFMDDCFLELCRIERADPAQLSRTHGRKIAVALAGIRRVMHDVTPAEIARRAARYSELNPTWGRPTAHALLNHWAKLGAVLRAQERPGSSIAEPAGWQAHINETSPDTPYAKGGDRYGTPWSALPMDYQIHVLREMKSRGVA